MAERDVRVQIKGARALMRMFGGVKSEYGALMKEANLETARDTARDATTDAPVLTGRLRQSIKPQASGAQAEVVAGRNLRYAAPVHWGWPKHGIEENPFMVRAAQANKDGAVTRYLGAIDKILARQRSDT